MGYEISPEDASKISKGRPAVRVWAIGCYAGVFIAAPPCSDEC